MWTVDCQRRLNLSLATEAKLDAINKKKASQNELRALSAQPPFPLPTTPSSALLSALATDRCNIQGNSSRVKPAAKQRVDSLAASQVGRQVGHFACCCYPQGLSLPPSPLAFTCLHKPEYFMLCGCKNAVRTVGSLSQCLFQIEL